MKIKRLLVKLKFPCLKRLLKKHVREPLTVEMEFYLRTEDLLTRELRYTKYNSMNEIVRYVYFEVPLTVPHYTRKNYSLVHKNLYTGKEHIIQLKTGKRTDCDTLEVL